MNGNEEMLRKGDALLIVDLQLDFCPGGALPIAEGCRIIEPINRWIAAAKTNTVPVYASRDWHPVEHISFVSQGGPWPSHCLQDSEGARFHPDLQLPGSAIKVTKGVRFDRDQNSAFDATGLAAKLRADGIVRLILCGLAEDVCVRATTLDALHEGFEAIVLTDATRPVTARGGEEARHEMRGAGAELISA